MMNKLHLLLLHRGYRLCAYRLYTSWIHGRLGNRVRVVIPACVVCAIRAAYPDDNATYVGFLAADSSTPWPW